MPTLDELLTRTEQIENDPNDLQRFFGDTFDIEGWTFERHGSIAYGVLEGARDHKLRVTAIEGPAGAEWQLNGITFLHPGEFLDDLEARRMALVRAAQSAGYAPKVALTGNKPTS